MTICRETAAADDDGLSLAEALKTKGRSSGPERPGEVAPGGPPSSLHPSTRTTRVLAANARVPALHVSFCAHHLSLGKVLPTESESESDSDPGAHHHSAGAGESLPVPRTESTPEAGDSES